MRSSESYRAPRQGMGRGYLWFVVVGNAVLGSFLVLVSLASLFGFAEGWSVRLSLLLTAVGAGWVAIGSVGFHRMYLHRVRADGHRVVLDSVEGAPAVVLHWRRVFLLQPLSGSVFVASLAAIVCVVMRLDGDAGWWVPLVIVVPLGLILPDKLIQVSRPARTVLTPAGIGVDGWDGSAWLDWDDVTGVVFTQVNQWTVMRTLGGPASPSWRWTRRPRVLYAAQPRAPYVDMPGPAMDVDSARLADAVMLYARTPVMRAELSGEAGRRRIVG